jgi:hypothetical protein
MKMNDSIIIETLEKKNDLESYIYNTRNALTGYLAAYVQND